MRILKKLFFLGYITPIFTYTILTNTQSILNEYEYSKNTPLYKRGVKDDELNKVSSECFDALTEIKRKCLMHSDLDMINLEKFCLSYNTKECQALYSNGTQSIPACENEDLPIYNMNITVIFFYKKYRCSRTENEEFCPFSLMDAENRKLIKIDKNRKPLPQSEKEFYINVNNTCKSRSCRDTYRNYIDDFISASIVEEKMNKIAGEETVTDDDLEKRDFKIEQFGKNKNLTATFEIAIEYLKTEECEKITEMHEKEINDEYNRRIKEEESDYEESEGTTILVNQNKFIICMTVVVALLLVI
ncbi:hypothetical protein PIROE2DRAFT_18442 [Piromyces sp. E2]|nr:hypothetical protein PIROE2DRAFT_18442 [Piromyces sp. E2]|eukprot:OUM56798.1 hypothetical protein PIROE2DRAFT_18442 [Piromyces sp. E2]